MMEKAAVTLALEAVNEMLKMQGKDIKIDAPTMEGIQSQLKEYEYTLYTSGKNEAEGMVVFIGIMNDDATKMLELCECDVEIDLEGVAVEAKYFSYDALEKLNKEVEELSNSGRKGYSF